jgi:prophage regulatory protein
MMLRMINTSDIFSIGETQGRVPHRVAGDLSTSAGTTRAMIDEDEGEQHAAAGEIRPMLSIKQVLALIPFSRATLYREMEAGRFPAAHEIAPRRIAWFKDEAASWQLGTKKVA